MQRLHTFGRQACIGVFLCSMNACSPPGYQSYRGGDSEAAVGAGQRWEIQLPYESSEALDIHVATANEILLMDKNGPLHITRIPLDAAGVPGDISHAAFEGADSMELFDENRLLILAPMSHATKRLRLVDRASLTTVYSVDLPFARSSDLTVPGWKRFGDSLVVYQSAIELDQRHWSDDLYQYALQYVVSAEYDLHVIDLRDRTVKSVVGLQGGSLEKIRTQILMSKAEVDTLADLKAPLHAMGRKPGLGQYVYLLEDVFLVDRGDVLVFDLKSLDGDSEYFTVDLHAPKRAPKREVAGVLAARYPGELVATPRPEKNDSMERKISVGGELYQVERLAFLKDGAVAIVREASRYGGDEEFSDFRMSMGIQPSVSKPEEWERMWDGHMLRYRNPIMTLLEDSEHGVVYFPDALSDERRPRFTVRGLRVRDGQWVGGFPANFQVEIDSKGKWAGVRITGTAVDFKHNRLYIHDASKNRLLAVELRLKN